MLTKNGEINELILQNNNKDDIIKKQKMKI